MNLSSIREHMKVVGNDRKPVGTVDHIEGSQIKLARNDPRRAASTITFPPTGWKAWRTTRCA